MVCSRDGTCRGRSAIRAQVADAPLRLGFDRTDLVQKGQQLGAVVAVATGQRHRQRDSGRIDEDVVLAAGAAAVYRAGGWCGAPRGRPDVRAIESTRGTSRSPGAVQPGQQQPVQLVLCADLGPIAQIAASTSCPSRSRVPGAAIPSGSRCRARTRPHATLCGHPAACAPDPDTAVPPPATTAGSAPTARPRPPTAAASLTWLRCLSQIRDHQSRSSC
jgi:hypothetical protein